MSDIATALSTLKAHGQHNASLLAVKETAKAEKQVVAMIDQLINSSLAVNKSGRGQRVNRYA